MTAKVVHCKIEPYDVYIGRPSIWGNPWSHKDDTLAEYRVNTVSEAVSMYRSYIESNDPLKEKAKRELKGKILGCWCKTKKNPDAPCHGDVLLEIANRE